MVIIDEYVEKNNIQRINLIKIDIEGAELFALNGMKNTLNRFRPVILMEVSEEVLQNSTVETKEVPDLMKSLNYEIKRIFKCGNTGDIDGSKSAYTNFAFFPAG